MKKKEKSTGAVFIMVMETSKLILFINLFIFGLSFRSFLQRSFSRNCYNKSRKTYAQDSQPR